MQELLKMAIKEWQKIVTNINCKKTIHSCQQKEQLNMPITNWKTRIEQEHRFKYHGNVFTVEGQCDTEIRSSF